MNDETLRIEVRDDGVGGARSDGSGIQGLADRLAALEGWLDVAVPAGGGTLVSAAIPIPPGASSHERSRTLAVYATTAAALVGSTCTWSFSDRRIQADVP